MGLSQLFLLLAFACATVAWVPRPADQDPSKTRQYGVLGSWRASDPGIMMNPEMITNQGGPLEEHPVPLFYDDDFAEPDGLYPRRTSDEPVSLSFSVDGSARQGPPRNNNYNLYRRGRPKPLAAAKPVRLTPEAMKEKYAWPRKMDRANNRELDDANVHGSKKEKRAETPLDF